MSGETIARAQGRWREILPALGIETKFLVNKHGPCPICGGRDRYRFDDRDGNGTYYCNQCGAGNGIVLLRKKNDWSAKEAMDRIDEIIGNDNVVAPPPKRTDDAKRRCAIELVLNDATMHSVVSEYLASRCISISSDALRGHKGLFHHESKRKWPAVVAPILSPNGELVSAQRIFVGAPDPRKKAMPPVGTINGGAVRLHDHAGILGVAEGIETSLAAHELFEYPVWAAITANGIETFQPPPDVAELIIFADNDENFVGQAAAASLAKRLHRSGIKVRVETPPTPGTDWADVLKGAANG